MANDNSLTLASTEELIASAEAMRAELDVERLKALASGVQSQARVVTTDDLQIPQSVLDAAADAIARFNASPTAQAIIALARSGQQIVPDDTFNDQVDALKAELVARLQAALADRTFAELFAAIKASGPLLGSGDAPIQGVSLGVGFVIGVGLVLQGTLGVAVDPSNLGNLKETVAFFSGSLDLGGVIVAEVEGIVLGLSRVPPSMMAGPSLNVTVSADVGIGVTFEASFSQSDQGQPLSGVSIGVGVGEGFEVAVGVSNTWIIGWDGKPRVYQPRANNYMMIQSIRCNGTGGLPGADDIYFTFKVDDNVTYRYPTHGQVAMSSGETWDAGRGIFFNNKVEVKLYDQDDGGDDDPRGSHVYTTSSFDYSKSVGDNGGSYTINAVLNPQPLVWTPAARINTVDATSAAPSFAVFGTRLYCFWRSLDASGQMYTSYSTDGTTWQSGKRINDSDFSPNGPTAIQFGDELFVFWRGGNQGAYWSTSSTGEAGSWRAGQRIGGTSYSTTSAPMPCVFKGTLYLFWNGTEGSQTGNRIVFSTYNSSSRSWSSPTTINNLDGSSYRVCACTFNNALHVFWRNSGTGSAFAEIFHSSSSTGTSGSFPWGTTINNGEKTKSGPAVNVASAVFNSPEQLFVYFNSNDNFANVIWTASSNGSSWPKNTPIAPNVATFDEFGAANFLNSQYLVWRGSDNGIYFCRSR